LAVRLSETLIVMLGRLVPPHRQRLRSQAVKARINGPFIKSVKMFETTPPRNDSVRHSATVCEFNRSSMVIFADPQSIVQAIHAKTKQALTLPGRE
jgi:hypothetical protein